MGDIYLEIADMPGDVIAAIAESLEARANEPAMQDICARYMGRLPRREGMRLLEIGCGAGAATRHLLTHLAPAELVAVDPSPGLLEVARRKLADAPQVTLREGGAEETGLPDASFDLVVAHTVYSHLADPDAALAEAFRVLKPGGCLAVFDGDYATITMALFEHDPLDTVSEIVRRNIVHAPYVMRGISARARAAGFEVRALDPYGYVQTERPDYMQSVIARGVDLAVRGGEIGPEVAEGLRAEAARRVAEGSFYGAILFLCLTAIKPEDA